MSICHVASNSQHFFIFQEEKKNPSCMGTHDTACHYCGHSYFTEVVDSVDMYWKKKHAETENTNKKNINVLNSKNGSDQNQNQDRDRDHEEDVKHIHCWDPVKDSTTNEWKCLSKMKKSQIMIDGVKHSYYSPCGFVIRKTLDALPKNLIIVELKTDSAIANVHANIFDSTSSSIHTLHSNTHNTGNDVILRYHLVMSVTVDPNPKNPNTSKWVLVTCYDFSGWINIAQLENLEWENWMTKQPYKFA